jgi:hypothetical protein
MPCKASPTEHLNKPTLSKVQLLRRVVNSFNSPYTRDELLVLLKPLTLTKGGL